MTCSVIYSAMPDGGTVVVAHLDLRDPGEQSPAGGYSRRGTPTDGLGGRGASRRGALPYQREAEGLFTVDLERGARALPPDNSVRMGSRALGSVLNDLRQKEPADRAAVGFSDHEHLPSPGKSRRMLLRIICR